jgi:hypothetical protein
MQPRLVVLAVLAACVLGALPEAGAVPVATEVVIDDVTAPEGTGGATTSFTFTVSLNAPDPIAPVTVSYVTADSGAKAPEDYEHLQGTLVFEPGETEKQIVVAVVADDVHEFNDTFTVRLLSATNAAIRDSGGQGMIMNDDAEPALSIDDVSVVEGNDGTSAAVFTVTLDRQSARVTSVWYETADGTAVAGSDYEARSGYLTLPQMATSGTITIPLVGDTVVEPDEAFLVNLGFAFPATVERGQGTATILNDDSAHPGKGKKKPRR